MKKLAVLIFATLALALIQILPTTQTLATSSFGLNEPTRMVFGPDGKTIWSASKP